jgi:mannose/fructose/N-acetylgalactosamine-specific phosphotransferase system component IIC
MTFFQALLIGFVYYFTNSAWTASLALYTLFRPLVAGTIVGLILGDLQTGVEVGLKIQLIFMGFMSTGGSMPSDSTIAGLVGTSLAIILRPTLGDAALDAGLALSVAVGTLGTFLFIGRMTWNTLFIQKAKEAAEAGDLKGLFTWHVIVPQVVLAVASIVPVTLFLSALGDANVVEWLNSLIRLGLRPLQVIGSLLPTVGIALTLMAIGKKNSLPFFIIGFALSQYFNLDIIGITIFGVMIAYLVYFAFDKGNQSSNPAESTPDF